MLEKSTFLLTIVSYKLLQHLSCGMAQVFLVQDNCRRLIKLAVQANFY